MPVPNSFFSMFEKYEYQSSKFPADNSWLDDFGAYKFCYIPNIRDVAGKFGLTDINLVASEAIKDEVLGNIPLQWKTEWPTGEFHKLATTQARDAWKRKPMRADKLAMVLVMINTAIGKHSNPVNHHEDVAGKTIFDVAKIRPAIYVPDDPGNKCRTLEVDHCLAIQREALQPQSNPIRTCGGYLGSENQKPDRGKPVTFPTASATARHLNSLVLQVSRSDIPAPKRANNGEVV